MIRNARTAVKFLVYGVIIGLMFAPQSGEETRKQLLGWLGESMQDTISTVTGGKQQSPSE